MMGTSPAATMRLPISNCWSTTALMPVNFMFYGVATEVIDEVLAESYNFV